jgi:hypothetical protein
MALIFPVLGWSQGSSTISGIVTDPADATIPSATVTVSEVGTGLSRTAQTGQDGYYSFHQLRPTDYVFTASAPGFKTYTQRGITLLVDQSLTLKVKLEVGSTSDAVTVSAQATQVNTTTGILAEVVESSRMVELPLNGRNAAQLTVLVAGASNAPNQNADQGATKTFPAAVTITINGSRQNWTGYYLDGVPNVDTLDGVNTPFPAPDALQEFSVQTSNYSAEFGQAAGGVVNVVTKSGANALRGDLFGYLRNAEFNARNFFAPVRDQLKRGQFGATLGGPIIHDKLFFFAEYQGTRLRNTQNGLQAFLPTNANRAGDFSALLSASNPANPLGKALTLKDPMTGQVFPGNLIPSSRLDPATLGMMKLLPAEGGNGKIVYSKPIIQNFDEVVGRGDYVLSGKDRLMGRFFWDRYIGMPVYDSSNLLTYTSGSTTPSQNVVLQQLHIFSPALLNDLRLGFSRENVSRGPVSNAPSVTDFGVTNLTQSSFKALEQSAVTGYFNFGDYNYARFPRQTASLNDDLRWVKGRHSLSFGGMYERDRFDQDNVLYRNGVFTFSGDSTGTGLADFLLGQLRGFTQSGGQFAHTRSWLGGLYAQDSFRVTPRLTLNFGLRWEAAIPWHDLYGQTTLFSPADFYAGTKSKTFLLAPAGLLFPTDPGVPADGVKGDLKNFAPRFGFAYDVFGTGKTSLRGGGGGFYETRGNAFSINRFSGVTPWQPQVQLTSPQGPFSNPYLGIADPFLTWNGKPSANTVFPAGLQVYTWAAGNKLVPPRAYQWNVAIEQQFRADMLVRASYVGMRGNHMNENVQLNPAVYIPGSSLATNSRRIFQGYGSIMEGSHDVNSWYNAFQLSVQKRLSHGFTVMANYTLSNATDNMPVGTDATSLGAGSAGVLPWYYPNAKQFERGPSDFDRRHVLVVSYVWQLPLFSHSIWVLRGAIGGWQFSGIVTAMTGLPLTVAAGLDQSKTGIGSDRGQLVSPNAYGAGACGSVAPCVNYLNPQAFALPAVGMFGNLGKGSLRSPGLFNWDMGLNKMFPIKERCQVQIRAEFFNTLNRANFNAPTSSVSSAGFGSVVSSADPRIGQLALKILF